MRKISFPAQCICALCRQSAYIFNAAEWWLGHQRVSASVFVFFILIVFPFEVDGDEVAKEMVEVDLKGPF